jgi:hypothetical protein
LPFNRRLLSAKHPAKYFKIIPEITFEIFHNQKRKTHPRLQGLSAVFFDAWLNRCRAAGFGEGGERGASSDAQAV